MKKSVFILTAALSFGVAAAQQAPAAPVTAQVPTLTDVPAGHWAKDAIDRLVTRGVLLGYPDGTFRGTQNLTRYEAAVIIARLLNQMGNGQAAGLDAETLTSLQNAVQELSADLAALGVRVNDLEENAVSKEDFNRLEERVEALDGSDLKGLAGRYDELSANYDTLRADVDDNASSIAALNDLTVLLNQDILNLQDRASALEAAQADFVTRTDFDALGTSVKSIDGRVTTLENAPKFSIGGSIEAKYGQVSLKDGAAGDFDLDLLNQNTFLGSYFSSDTYCGISVSATRMVLERGNKGVRCIDTSQNLSDIIATVNFGVSNLSTKSGNVKVNSANITLKAKNTKDPASVFNLGSTNGAASLVSTDTNTFVALAHADLNASSDNGVKFSVAFDDGINSNSNFKFNDYLFANDNDTDSVNYRRGVVATVDASSLSSLSPKVTFVAGNTTPQLFSKTFNGVVAQYPTLSAVAAPTTGNTSLRQLEPLVGGYFGVRASINPYNLGTVGLSYAQGNVNVPAAFSSTFIRRDAVSADADLKVGPATLQGVFVASYLNTVDGGDLDNADKAGYIKFGVDISGIKLHANYHYIDPEFENGVAGMSTNDSYFYSGMQGSKSSAPFAPNENGFGADASANVGPIGVGAYVNSFKQADESSDINGWKLNGVRQTAYGVKLGSATIRGFNGSLFFNDARIDDQRITELFGNDTYQNQGFGYVPDGFDWANTSSYGIALHHDGAASDAFVPKLNLNLTYARLYDDVVNVRAYKYDDAVIAADYNGKFGMFTLKPFARYHYFHNPYSGQELPSNAAANGNYRDGSVVSYEGAAREQYTFNSYKIGIQASTDALDVVSKPSLYGNIAYRNTDFKNSGRDNTTEMLANVGVSFNEFIFPNNKLSVGYSYYQGFNVDNNNYYDGISRYYRPFTSDSDVISGATSNQNWLSFNRNLANRTVQGVYGQWEAWGLTAAYGYYTFKNLNTNLESKAQAFKVSAKLNF